MNLLTITLPNQDVINVSNDFFGEETITFNNKIVSQKKTFWGGKHSFTITENGENKDYRLNIKMDLLGRIYIKLIENEKEIYNDKAQQTNQNLGASLFMFVVGIVFGFTVVHLLKQESVELKLGAFIALLIGLYLFANKYFKKPDTTKNVCHQNITIK
jgi:hypothetical protein